MKKYLLAVSFITCIVGTTLASKVQAVTLYNAGSLRNALGEVSNNFTQTYDILSVLKGASPNGDKLAQYILSPEGQQVLLKYGFTSSQKSTSIPEGQGIAGIVLALSVAFILQKKLAQKQQVKIIRN